MAFAAGAAIFNSCNKQGSIAHFTEHLKAHPNDFNSLMWRARAHSIVGNAVEALSDIKHALSTSYGVQRAIANCMFVLLSTNDLKEYGVNAQRAVERYGDEWSAWKELAHYHSMNNENEKAVQCWEKALSLAKEKQEMENPEVCWINYELGQNRLKNGDVAVAKGYFTDAVRSCPTHTVSHIRICESNILQGNIQEARDNFKTATKLNPTLSSAVFGTDNFDEFLLSKVTKPMEMMSLGRQPKASSKSRGVHDTAGAAGGGGRSGNGSGSIGDSSDDDDIDVNALWKKLQKESPCIKRYRGHKYVQSKCGEYWYSRDTARHGGAQFKRYENTGNTLRFKDSLDAKLKPMSNKHESREGSIIKKSDMTGVKGK